MLNISKNIIGLLVLFLATMFFSNMAQAAGSICSLQADQIPAGQVVERTNYDSNCSGPNNRLFYDTPATSSTNQFMCSVFTGVPNGFVVIGTGQQIDCNANSFGNGFTSYRIRVPQTSGTTYVCALVSPVPDGFVVIDKSRSSSSTCDNISNSQQLVIRVPSATGTTKICTHGTTPIPAGFVVTNDRGTSSLCSSGTSISGTQLTIQPPSSGIWMCDGWGQLVPDGFAAIGTSSTRSSCSGNATQIGAPTNNSIICGLGDAPAGFVKTAVVSSLSCESGVGSRVRQISTIGQTEVVSVCGTSDKLPNGFVITELTTSSNCVAPGSPATGHMFKMRKPAVSGTTATCSNNFPAGYGVVSTTSTSLCAYVGSGLQYTIAPYTDGGTYCRGIGGAVPANWVVTRISSTSSCSTNFSHTIGLPSTTGNTLICESDAQKIPAGYVVIEQDPILGSSYCGNVIASVITLPSSTGETLICDASPVPTGFAVVRTGLGASRCSFNNLAKVIRPINATGTFYICAGSTIPDGFVIISQFHSSSCDPNISANAHMIEPLNSIGTTTVCTNSPLPTGTVIFSNTSANACAVSGAGPAYVIGYPDPVGTSEICRSSVIPAGFAVIDTVNTTACGSDTIAYVISPGGLLLPSEFVSPLKNIVPGTVPGTTYNCGGSPQSGGFISGEPRNTACN